MPFKSPIAGTCCAIWVRPFAPLLTASMLAFAEVAEWQSRPLSPVMVFDAIRVRGRDQVVSDKAVTLALEIALDGRKHILGLWIDPDMGAKFWLRIVNERGDRGIKDILIAVCWPPPGCPGQLSQPSGG